MSRCISSRGEYSDHELDEDFVCSRCFTFDEFAAMAELTKSRDTVKRLIGELAALCDDDWLRRRDRCMGLPGANGQFSRRAASAWEQAAHMLRVLITDHGYDLDLDRHGSYNEWVRDGRDHDGEAGDYR